MYSQQFTLCYCLVKSLLLRICLRHQSVITFFSGASPPKKNPGSAPVLCLLAVREKPNLANLNKIAACGVWAVQVTTLYRITLCCVCIIYLFIYLFFIVSVQFGKKCDPPKPERFSNFHSHKMHLFDLLGLLTDRNDSFPYPFIDFN